MSKEDVDRIMVRLTEITDEMMIDLAFAIHRVLVDNPPSGTPIDTGYCSAKWWFGVGSMPPRIEDGDINVEVIMAARFAMTDSMVEVSNYKIQEGSLFIYNDTDYIEYLNEGSSQQSPAFFVEDAVDKGLDKTEYKYGKTIEL